MSGTKKQSKKEMAREEEEQVEEEQQQEEQVSYPPVASVVASIFKTISLDETDVSTSFLSANFIFTFYQNIDRETQTRTRKR